MRVLLAPTSPGWAFDHRARDLLSLEFDNLDLDLKYLHAIRKNDLSKYDLIYPMTFEGAFILHEQHDIPPGRMAAGITSLRSLEKYRKRAGGFKSAFVRFLNALRGINTASDEIVGIIRPVCPIFKTRVGIDHNVFKPAPSGKKKDEFKVGWVGRIDKPEYRELKGYDLVLEALKGLDVRLDIRTYKEHYIPRRKMAGFYQQLDCFICSSSSEHIPLPVLEAAACGVPIISTRVGIVPELIRHGHNGWIVPRSPESIRKQVIFVMKHPRKRKQVSEHIRQTVLESWTWERCKKDWETFFKSIS